jgi:transcription antitermination factor NusG
MLRLRDNPPQLAPADQFEGPAASTQTWFAAYTKPRQEKALAWNLLRKGIPYFLPMLVRETSGGGRRRRNLHPLFPSYLFVAGGDHERLAVLKTDRVVRLIEPTSGAQARLGAELAAIEAALRIAPDAIELYPRLAAGARAVIRSGPLKGFEGVILAAENKRKFWLGVTALGAGITVEIHADLLEPEGAIR